MIKNLNLLGLSLFLFISLTSCSKFNLLSMGTNSVNVTPIAEVKKQPKDTMLYIQGEIEKQVPLLLSHHAYEIKDATGKIWVVTNQTNLQVGQEAVIKGKIKYMEIPSVGTNYHEAYIKE